MSVPQVISVIAVQHVTIQMDPTRASVTTATREMDEPVEVQARSRCLKKAFTIQVMSFNDFYAKKLKAVSSQRSITIIFVSQKVHFCDIHRQKKCRA